jgi:uncharacterized membrane protein
MTALAAGAPLSRAQTIAIRVFGTFFVVAGINHFLNPDFYLRIIPPYVPFHDATNAVSGAAEIVLGLGLFAERFRRLAAWGSIALLVAVFPANIYAFQHQELIPAPPLAHLLRLPLQAVFIGLVYWGAGLGSKAPAAQHVRAR